MGAWFAYLLASSLAPHEAQTGVATATTRGYSLPWRCRVAALSQSEDQSRPHPVPGFVRPMSTQVRSLSLDTPEGAYLPDPQIADPGRQARGKIPEVPHKPGLCRETRRAPDAPSVLASNKYRSHDEQVPFSRAISTVLAEEGVGGRSGRMTPDTPRRYRA